MESKVVSFSFVGNWYPNSVLAQILHEADGRRLKARLWWSHSHSWEKAPFSETRLRIIFLALIWRDEIVIIIWSFSYFETRTRLHIVALMFRDEIETYENHFSWSSEKKWNWLSSRISGIKNSRSREFATRVSFIFTRSTTRNDFHKSRSRLETWEQHYVISFSSRNTRMIIW